MALRNFALPDLGEGLTESEIVSWRVSVGDTVELNQIIAEVETAKALVELPSPFAGVISGFFAEPGSTVAVGAPIVAFDVTDSVTDSAMTDAAAPVITDASVAPTDAAPAPAESNAGTGTAANAVASTPVSTAVSTAARIEREPMLVGYGPPVENDSRPKRRARAGTHAGDSAFASSAGLTPVAPEEVDRLEVRPRSTPPVRALARDLGVDVSDVTGTGEHGLVTRDDVLGRAASAVLPPEGDSALMTPGQTGREIRVPIQGVRKHIAQAMVASAFTAPHATEFLTIDVTPTVELLARLKTSHAFAGQRLTMLTIVAKALCIAVGRTPSVNSRWDDAAQEFVQFGYINLGIAAATPRGLMVPNVKNADRLALLELAGALTALVDTAKSGRSSTEELRGGTISITNIGVFGIDAGTPILNPGEAAILATGAVRRMPWEFNDDIALRQVMTLSLSFDHRLVDGEQASRFLADVGTILADPGMLLTMV